MVLLVVEIDEVVGGVVVEEGVTLEYVEEVVVV